MKVAIVTTRHGAQDDRIYYKQALSLIKRMDVTLIAPDDGEKLHWHPGVIYRPIPRRRSLLGRFRSLVEATREICREKPDFCHLHDLDLALAIPFIRLLTKAKIIYDSHEAFPEQFMMNPRIPFWFRFVVARAADWAEKGLVGFAVQVICADDPTRISFNKTHLPSATIFNYPPLSIFETDSAKLEAEKAKYKGRLPLIYQGTMSEDRGLFHMIDALAVIKKSEPRILLRLVGLKNEKLRANVEAQIRKNGVSDEVEIVHWMPHQEIAYAMKSSQIGLVPWQPEEKHKKNIPIKLFEYMACGLPMIAADLPSIAFYFKKANVGLLYDSTRPEELARCVLELLADSERCRRMGENGLQAVRESWNWDKMEKMLFGVYESLGARLKENPL